MSHPTISLLSLFDAQPGRLAGLVLVLLLWCLTLSLSEKSEALATDGQRSCTAVAIPLARGTREGQANSSGPIIGRRVCVLGQTTGALRGRRAGAALNQEQHRA